MHLIIQNHDLAKAMHPQTLNDRIGVIVAGVLRHRQSIIEPRDGRTFHDLDLNALDRIFIADALEREWAIELDEDEIDAWQTLEDIAISVHNRMP
jgi:acyl carrier protein